LLRRWRTLPLDTIPLYSHVCCSYHCARGRTGRAYPFIRYADTFHYGAAVHFSGRLTARHYWTVPERTTGARRWRRTILVDHPTYPPAACAKRGWFRTLDAFCTVPPNTALELRTPNPAACRTRSDSGVPFFRRQPMVPAHRILPPSILPLRSDACAPRHKRGIGDDRVGSMQIWLDVRRYLLFFARISYRCHTTILLFGLLPSLPPPPVPFPRTFLLASPCY